MMFNNQKTTTASVLPTQTSTPSFNFQFGTAQTATTAASTTVGSGINFGIGTTPGLTVAPSTGFATSFNLPTTTLATTTSSIGFGLPTTTTATTTSVTSQAAGLTFSLGVTTTTATSTVPTTVATSTAVPTPATPSINFTQLEEIINKWTVELQEQEQVFFNQVTQVREWDMQLLGTGERIVSLDEKVQKVKLKQQQLEHELDFIVAQQKELEESLTPLEKAFENIAINDPERDPIYERAENVNAQLENISEEIKSIIEHINEKNKVKDINNPIAQIGEVLNAHMNSLQWIERNTGQMQQLLDQIKNLREAYRREAD